MDEFNLGREDFLTYMLRRLKGIPFSFLRKNGLKLMYFFIVPIHLDYLMNLQVIQVKIIVMSQGSLKVVV